MNRLVGFLNAVAAPIRHPIGVERVERFRAYCTRCPWVGPLRDWEMDADQDRNRHRGSCPGKNGSGVQP